MSNHTSIVISPISESARYASEIRGRLSEDKVVIAVEGDDDLRIDRKLFQNNVAIVPVQGKTRIESLSEELFDKYPRNFIAIKDADFDHLNGKAPSHKNIFLTDKHDMEMTMVDSEIVESIIAEYLCQKDNYEEICNGENLIDSILNHLKDYSYIKWLNDVEDCRINFDVVTMADLGADKAVVTVESALRKLYNSEANNRLEVKKVNLDNVVEFKQQHPCNDLAMLICGHDFTNTMLEWMKKQGSESNINRKKLESIIRMLYNSTKFHTTSLYKQIHDWEIEKGRDIVA